MKKNIVFMFSGQGSQYYQMGRELYENHARFRLWMDYCDDIASPLIGASLTDILYQDSVSSGDSFDDIMHTNPALLCIEYSLARILMEMKIQPDYLLGYSLGEVTASVISGAVSLEQGIELAVEFAKLLKQREPSVGGAGMLAVIGSVDVMAEFPELFKGCWLASRNCNKSFVLAGLEQNIRQLKINLSERGIYSQRLPVNYGFHTELINPLKTDFKQLIANLNIGAVNIPIISAFTTELLQQPDEEYFWQVMRQPVNFELTISKMLREKNYIFIDVGPSGSLATFVKYISVGEPTCVHLETINPLGKNLQSIQKLLKFFEQSKNHIPAEPMLVG